MSAPFVAQLRSNRPPILLAPAGESGTITLRMSVADIWETVRIVARPETPADEIKQRVVAEFFPDAYAEDFVLKLHGWEVLNENASLADCGVVDGSILLLAYRRRRAVR